MSPRIPKPYGARSMTTPRQPPTPALLAPNAVDSGTLDALASQIREAHKRCRAGWSAGLAHAIEAGQLLRQAKGDVDHGEWLPWLAANCPDISERLAQRYIQIAREFGKLEECNPTNPTRVADLSFRGALKVLADNARTAGPVMQAADDDPETFQPLVDEMNRKGKVNGTLLKMKNLQAQKERAKIKAPIHGSIRVGDFRKVMDDVPDGSVDLIFTDPPYDKESILLYGVLAKLAARVLAPGGSLVCYAGHHAQFDMVLLMSHYIPFRWPLVVRHSGGQRRMHGYRVRVGYKPLLWFVHGQYHGEYIQDLLDSKPGDKVKHEWAQGCWEAEYLIERLCPPGGLVLDPMAGSGTTLKVAKALGRRFLGVEIDPDRARVASADLQ
jgi:16S rRNA G966 N2-methylase RsmD